MTATASRIGIAAALLCLLILVAIAVPLFNKRARCGVASLSDQTQMVDILKALVISAGEDDGRLLTPSRLTGAASHNHSAPLLSAMVMGQYIAPEKLVSHRYCGLEPNESVTVKLDYDFNCYSPDGGVWWDPGFAMRIDDPQIGANASYAHMALCGERLERDWRSASSEHVPMLSTRGPEGGSEPGMPEYDRSITLTIMGPAHIWYGNIAFGDGHTEITDTFRPAKVAFTKADGTRSKDNIFAAEFDHPRGNEAAGDAFLCVSIGATADTVTEVVDPLQ